MGLMDVSANQALLEYLRMEARPGRGTTWDLDGWELHVHPDLSDRLREIAPSASEVIPVYGVHVLATFGIAAGFVQGTSTLMLRLPSEPKGLEAVKPSQRLVFRSPDWYAVDPWQSNLPRPDSLRKFRQLTQAAIDHSNPTG